MRRQNADVLRLAREVEASARRKLRRLAREVEARTLHRLAREVRARRPRGSAREVEALALRKLHRLDIDFLMLSEYRAEVIDCERALRLVAELRRSIRQGKARDAALHSFRLGQTVTRQLVRQTAEDANRGRMAKEASRAGGLARGAKLKFPEKIVEFMESKMDDLARRRKDLSYNRRSGLVAQNVAETFERSCSPRTVRRYVPQQKI